MTINQRFSFTCMVYHRCAPKTVPNRRPRPQPKPKMRRHSTFESPFRPSTNDPNLRRAPTATHSSGDRGPTTGAARGESAAERAGGSAADQDEQAADASTRRIRMRAGRAAGLPALEAAATMDG